MSRAHRYLLGVILFITGLCKGGLNIRQRPTHGIASYYGIKFQGRRMANGHPYDRHALTCASRYYKLGTILTVRYPARGTFVNVIVTDSGPWIKGRCIDLSERAAEVLGLKERGIGYVEIEPVRIL